MQKKYWKEQILRGLTMEINRNLEIPGKFLSTP
jgi:hypothetical protein